MFFFVFFFLRNIKFELEIFFVNWIACNRETDSVVAGRDMRFLLCFYVHSFWNLFIFIRLIRNKTSPPWKPLTRWREGCSFWVLPVLFLHVCWLSFSFHESFASRCSRTHQTVALFRMYGESIMQPASRLNLTFSILVIFFFDSFRAFVVLAL